jgi:hypothetical protein
MENWNQLKEENNNLIYKRQFLYWDFMGVTLLIIGISLYLWPNPPLYDEKGLQVFSNESCLNWMLAHLADVMRYALPDIFNGFIDYVVLKRPESLLILGIIGLFFKCLRKKLKGGQTVARREMRKLIVKKWTLLKEQDQVNG